MYFSNRDLTFIGIVGAVGLALSYLLGMTTRAISGMPFLGSLIAGGPKAFLIIVALCKTKKAGTVTFVEAILAITAFFRPGSFPFALISPLVGGIITDFAFWLMTKQKRDDLGFGQGAILGGLLNGLKPVSTLLLLIILGLPGKMIVQRRPVLFAVILTASFGIGALFGFIGVKITRELKAIGLLA
ncbi:hypothetical protein JXL19_02400 [bacterium]|nr:hypothetical protein [bacterium]